ncbi:hypothetical protein BGZ75_004015 [Mortierella antarctica]|nr:hypothetical protein BGZ75_004015 [Mortierella antarctica]
MASTRAILENVFGMLGIVFWSFQLLPQVIDNYKAKSTEGLSYSMFFIWTLAALGFGSYSIVEDLSIPIIMCYCQCLYYGMRWSLRRTVVASSVMFVAMAGIQVAAVYGTRAGKDHQVTGTVEAAGIIPILLLALGFMPQYADIYKDRSVVGVSMAFIAADALGAVFSLVSLAFRTEFDLLATLNYVVVLVCDLLVVALFVYYNKLNPSLARERAPPQARGKTADLEQGTTQEEEEEEHASAATTVVENEPTPREEAQ